MIILTKDRFVLIEGKDYWSWKIDCFGYWVEKVVTESEGTIQQFQFKLIQ